jgi:hypothetical protein
MGFIFRLEEDSHKVLDHHWKWGLSMLFLKPWTPFFNLQYEKMTITPVWVKLLGLLVDLWSFKMFKEIENALGTFIDVDMSFPLEYGNVLSVRVLDSREGLAMDMTLQKGGFTIFEDLDYCGVPFKCV